jgi:hypothetical protein
VESTVTLVRQGDGAEISVTVGVLVQLDVPPSKSHFDERELLRTAKLGSGAEFLERHKTPEKTLVACALAAVTGVEGFRQKYSKPFDCQIRALEGRNLSEDCTVGFSLAAFKAAAKAVNSAISPDEQAFGWREVSK